MKWTETPDQVKGYFKRKDITKWEIIYSPETKTKTWIIHTITNPKVWEWIEKNVEY
jgi:hypothetical protein